RPRPLPAWRLRGGRSRARRRPRLRDRPRPSRRRGRPGGARDRLSRPRAAARADGRHAPRRSAVRADLGSEDAALLLLDRGGLLARAERVLPPRAARGGHARVGRALAAARQTLLDTASFIWDSRRTTARRAPRGR